MIDQERSVGIGSLLPSIRSRLVSNPVPPPRRRGEGRRDDGNRRRFLSSSRPVDKVAHRRYARRRGLDCPRYPGSQTNDRGRIDSRRRPTPGGFGAGRLLGGPLRDRVSDVGRNRAGGDTEEPRQLFPQRVIAADRHAEAGAVDRVAQAPELRRRQQKTAATRDDQMHLRAALPGGAHSCEEIVERIGIAGDNDGLRTVVHLDPSSVGWP
jgi:hypothetical protein